MAMMYDLYKRPTPKEMVDDIVEMAARDMACETEAYKAEVTKARTQLQMEMSKRPMGDGRPPMRTEDMSGMMSTPVNGRRVSFMKEKVTNG